MSRTEIQAEEIVAKLRQIEILLDGEIFYTLREAQAIVESWRRYYNPLTSPCRRVNLTKHDVFHYHI